MAALERFLAQSVKDMQLDRIAQAFLGNHAQNNPDAAIAAMFAYGVETARQTARDGNDAEIELHIDYE